MEYKFDQFLVSFFADVSDPALRLEWLPLLVGSQAILGEAVVEVIQDCEWDVSVRVSNSVSEVGKVECIVSCASSLTVSTINAELLDLLVEV